MKLLLNLLFILIALPVYAQYDFSNIQSDWKKYEVAIYNNVVADRVQKELPAFTPIEASLEKRKISRYLTIYYDAYKYNLAIPNYMDYRQDSEKFEAKYKQDFYEKYEKPDQHNRLDGCTKVAFEEISCPEGKYTFTDNKLGKEINDNSRKKSKPTDETVKPDNKSSNANKQ